MVGTVAGDGRSIRHFVSQLASLFPLSFLNNTALNMEGKGTLDLWEQACAQLAHLEAEMADTSELWPCYLIYSHPVCRPPGIL